MMSDATTDGTRQWSRPAADDWIHRSRPPRTTAVQSTGTLAWPQKMSARQDFLGDPLLPGVDHLGLGRGGGDLVEVPLLDGIAEDDSHGMACDLLRCGQPGMLS